MHKGPRVPPAHRVRKGLLGRLVLPGLRARRAIPDPRRPCVSSPVRTPFAVGTTKPWFRWCVLTARPTGPNVPPQAPRPRAYVCASDWRPHSVLTPRAVSSAKLCRSFYRRSATHCAKAIALGCGGSPSDRGPRTPALRGEGHFQQVRYWHLADMQLAYVRFRGKSGHRADMRLCPLMTAGSTGRRNTLCLEGERRSTRRNVEGFFEASLRQRNRGLWHRWQCAQDLGVQTPADRMRWSVASTG